MSEDESNEVPVQVKSEEADEKSDDLPLQVESEESKESELSTEELKELLNK